MSSPEAEPLLLGSAFDLAANEFARIDAQPWTELYGDLSVVDIIRLNPSALAPEVLESLEHYHRVRNSEEDRFVYTALRNLVEWRSAVTHLLNDLYTDILTNSYAGEDASIQHMKDLAFENTWSFLAYDISEDARHLTDAGLQEFIPEQSVDDRLLRLLPAAIEQQHRNTIEQ